MFVTVLAIQFYLESKGENMRPFIKRRPVRGKKAKQGKGGKLFYTEECQLIYVEGIIKL